MSLLIKGMEMPKGLAERGFVIRGDGRVRTFNGAVIDYATAVPVPPHGRLIDAEELLKMVRCRPLDEYGEYPLWYVGEDDIKNAPTVILAEEGEI